MKRLVTFFFVTLLHCSIFGQTNRTVFPAGLENKDGNGNLELLGGSIQELFRASALTPSWQSPVEITDIAFRVDSASGSFAAVVPRIDLRLFTTFRAPEQMVVDYEFSRGPEETIVYAHDNVLVSGSVGSPSSPFDVRFHLD